MSTECGPQGELATPAVPPGEDGFSSVERLPRQRIVELMLNRLDKGEGRVGDAPSSLDRFDVSVLALILLFGGLQFFLYQRSKDFLTEDVFYLECARSLIQHAFYGTNGRPETNQPPGLPAILTVLCLIRACSHAALLRTMVVFETLGFVLTYAFLRNRVPRAVAAAICLLLISSPIYFALATQWVFPCFPYFATTIGALLVAPKLERSTTSAGRLGWGLLLAALVMASLMLASAAVALLAALVAVIVLSFFRDWHLGISRLRTYFAVLVLGLAVQGLWMHRKAAPLEWPLPGYPRPYLEQLHVRSGNNPELGMATPRDVLVRVADNGLAHTEMLVQLLYGHWVNVYWASSLIMGPILLMSLGWGYSVWQTGGELHDWYFAGYEFIYLLWPWRMEARFFLPIAPLACMYLWLGLRALVFLAKDRPRALGLVWFPIGVVLAIVAFSWERGIWIGRGLMRGGLQDELSLAVWSLSAIAAAWLAYQGLPSSPPSISRFSGWYSRKMRFLRVSPRSFGWLVAGLVLAVLISDGLAAQLHVGRVNLTFDQTTKAEPPDVRAGLWIRSNTASGAIVMARLVPTVYYYSERKVVWFPPTSNAQMLMEGIRTHRINYVIVADRKDPYYLPPDDDSFAQLFAVYPDAFRLAFEASDFRIFELTKEVQ